MLAFLFFGSVAFVVSVGAQPAGAITWQEPVDAPVLDPFRPPAGPYAPGNRGIEYDIGPGTAIYAVDSGRVVFAGRIGPSLHVVVDHGEGLKSTYAFMESSSVVRGQTVSQGDRIGTAGPGFHLTARLWGEYVDPALFFAGAEIEVKLIEGHSAKRTRGSEGVIRLAPAKTVRNWHPFGGLVSL